MVDKKDGLETRRWFRRRLVQLGQQYPELQEPERQQRLREALGEDGTSCHANQQDEGEEGRSEADS